MEKPTANAIIQDEGYLQTVAQLASSMNVGAMLPDDVRTTAVEASSRAIKYLNSDSQDPEGERAAARNIGRVAALDGFGLIGTLQ